MIAILIAIGLPLVADPQQGQPVSSSDARPVQAASDDIVVSGLRDMEEKDSAVTQQTLGSSRVGSAVDSRRTFEHSQRWANCAIDNNQNHRALLRQIFNSRTNSTLQDEALRRLAQINATCAPDVQLALADGIVTNPYYDRGSLTIGVLKAFVPGLRLTKAQTSDPVVQARLNTRETPLARFRLPVDMRYFEAAICFARLQPELAVKLAMTGKPLATVRRLEAAIVNRSRICVGNARHVYFDGAQFRFYIADAVYRWALAVRGVETLIPTASGTNALILND